MVMKAPNSMSKAARRSKLLALSLAVITAASVPAYAAEAQAVPELKKKDKSLSVDMFEQGMYYPATQYLRFDRLYRTIFRKKTRAKDVNIYDEVPDNAFFTNRQGRKGLSADELSKGYRENGGLDLSKPLEIQKGNFGEFNNRVFVKDVKGATYLLKFDHAEALGLATAAEVISNRFYYAIGYNVPQNDLVALDPDQLVPGEGAKIYDGTGFSKKLTSEKLQESLLFLPQTEDGKYLVIASKIINGTSAGASGYQGKRNHPDDPYKHEDRRELRAFPVFASWMNHVDVRNQNTLQILQEENGKKALKHFLVDTDTSFGADPHGVKPANFGHVYMFDYWDTTKAVFTLGLVEKPWQKRWRIYGEPNAADAASKIGYFDNYYFDPGKFKVWLQSYAYNDMTVGDAFWAAKIIMSFSDQDIDSTVKSVSFTSAENQELLSKTLKERRDIIGRYWFGKVCPVDQIDVQGGKLVFEDLAVRYGFEKKEGTVYHVDVFSKNGKHKEKITSFTSTDTSLPLDASWNKSGETVLLIRVTRNGSKPSPAVKVKLQDGKITRIAHQN